MQDALATLCEDLLSAAATAMEPPNTENGPPLRQLVSIGPPAEDCDQLAVYWNPVRALVQNRCAAVPVVPLVVVRHRCVTAITERGGRPQPPSAEIITAEALALAVDGWALRRGILAARRAGTLFAGIGCDDITVGLLEQIAPEGMIAGVRFTVEVLVGAPAATGS